jgi:excisionase family DNA binding protein
METSMSLSFPDLPQISERAALPAAPRSRFLTVFEVAEIVGCHAETVRRAYSCGQLTRRRFGVRGCRFTMTDVEDWMSRGAPTRPDGRESGAGRLVRLAHPE